MVNNFRDCDENWRGRNEVQSTWEKKYILKYKSEKSIYTSIIKFRYLEDYKKMRKVNKMLGNILEYLENAEAYNTRIITSWFKNEFMYIELATKELNKLKDYVRDCNFLNVDYDDGEVFKSRFKFIFDLLKKDKFFPETGKYYFTKMLREDIYPPLE